MKHSVLLAFDTSSAHCVVGLIAGGTLLGTAVEPMAKGQAERILVLCEEVLARSNLTFQDLTAIGVGVGPGNFTGIRISVSAARGLALGLGIPAIPVSQFEMARDPADLAAHEAELVIVEAPRGTAYAQPFRNGRPTAGPEIIDPSAPPIHFAQPDLRITGYQADEIARALGAIAAPATEDDPATCIARMTDWKIALQYDMVDRPAPLYVRTPDAAPARDKPPTILP